MMVGTYAPPGAEFQPCLRRRRRSHEVQFVEPRSATDPLDDLEPPVEVLDDRRAAFDPVAAIDVAQAGVVADHGMMDVPADHAVNAAPASFGGERGLELADEVDGILHFQLRPLRQRPVGQAERAANRVEMGVEPDREVVGVVAEQREPARVPNHNVEQIAMDDEVALAVGANVDGVFDHLDAAEMRAVVVAQELVVVAGDVEQARALARLPQELLHDVVVGLRPVPARSQLPAVDNVAHEIDRVGFVVTQEVEELVGLAALRAEMDVRQKQRPNAHRPLRHSVKHQQFPPTAMAVYLRFPLQGDDGKGAGLVRSTVIGPLWNER